MITLYDRATTHTTRRPNHPPCPQRQVHGAGVAIGRRHNADHRGRHWHLPEDGLSTSSAGQNTQNMKDSRK